MNLRQKLLSGAVLLGVSSLLSRLLGLLRDRIFATTFGAVGGGIHDLDTYYAAFRLPDTLFQLLLYGAISAAFVPIFTSYIKKNQSEEGWRFANNSLNILTTLLIIVSIIALIFAPWIVKIFVPGFSGEKLALTTTVTRIMLISPLFFGLSSVFQSIQNSLNRYFYMALAPIMYNISIIVATLAGAKEYGVYAVAIGVVAGAFLHAAVQFPEILKLGFHWRPTFNFKAPDIKEMVRLLIPRVAGLSVFQVNLVINTLIGSLLASGSITILNYAINLNSLPMGIVGVSISIVAFGVFAELVAGEEHEKFFHILKENFYKVVYLIVPATVAMIILRHEIVGLILKTGKFTSHDVALTAETLGILSIGLLAQSLIPLFARAFYAYKNTRTPLYIAIFGTILNVALSIALTQVWHFGVYGLAISTAIAGTAHWIMLQTTILKHLPHQGDKFIDIGKIVKIIISAALMGVVVYFTKDAALHFIGNGIIGLSASLAIACAVGLIVYFGAIKILRYRSENRI
ncbi:murein biosynthesis integral membrane protein MurJ [Candidatus Peregrinibacteria bacterium]|nr:murein biosynthesis integral membrane protein MurJ [Candidatus Peregrinibacteria bacterium]